MLKLDPADFPPSRTEQKRAKKREAQRKYRRGIRLRPKASDNSPTSTQPPTAQATMAQAEQHGQPEQPQQLDSAKEKHRACYYQYASPVFSNSHLAHCQSRQPFADDHFDDVLTGEAFSFGGEELMRGPRDHAGIESLAGTVTRSRGSLSVNQQSTARPGAMSGAVSQCGHADHWGARSEPITAQSSHRSKRLPTSPYHHSSSQSTATPTYHFESMNRPRSPPNSRGGARQSWGRMTGSPAALSDELPMLSSQGSPAAGLQGCTPLFQAVLLGNLGIVAILTSKNCNPNALNEMGQTVLHVASREGHAEIVDHLLKCGANLNACDSLGNTPLHLAVMHGREQVVETLVNAGAKTDIMNRASW